MPALSDTPFPYTYVLSGRFLTYDVAYLPRSGTLVFQEKNAYIEDTYTTRTYTIHFPSNIKRAQISACIQAYLGPKYRVIHFQTHEIAMQFLIHSSEPGFKFKLLETGTATKPLKFTNNLPGYRFFAGLASVGHNATVICPLYLNAEVTRAGALKISYDGVTQTSSTKLAKTATATQRLQFIQTLASGCGCRAELFKGVQTILITSTSYKETPLIISGTNLTGVGINELVSIPAYPAMLSSAEGAFPRTSDVIPGEDASFFAVTSAVLQDYGPSTTRTRITVNFSAPISAASPITAEVFTLNGQTVDHFEIESGVLYCYISLVANVEVSAPYSFTYTPTTAAYLQDENGERVEAFTQSCSVLPAEVTTSTGVLLISSANDFTGQQDSLRITIDGVDYDSPLLNFNTTYETADSFIADLKAAWPDLDRLCDIFAYDFYTVYLGTNPTSNLYIAIKPKEAGVSFSPLVSLHNSGSYAAIMNLPLQIILSDVQSPYIISNIFGKFATADTVRQTLYCHLTTLSGTKLLSTSAVAQNTFVYNVSLNEIATKTQAALPANDKVLINFEARTNEYGQGYIVGVISAKNLGTCAIFTAPQVASSEPYATITNGIGLSPLDYSDSGYPILERAELIRNAGNATIKLYYDRALRKSSDYATSSRTFSAVDTSGNVVTLNSEFSLADSGRTVVITTSKSYTDTTIYLTSKCYAAWGLMTTATTSFVTPPFQNLKIDVPAEPPILQKGSVIADTVRLQYDKELSTTLVPNAQNFVIDVTQ